MIFFNWKLVKKKSNKSLKKTIQIIKHITYRDIPWSEKSPDLYFSYTDWSGSSWLLNPEELIRSLYGTERKISKQDFYVYIELASRRNYSLYRLGGELGLDIRLTYGYNYYIQNNPILEVKNDMVRFYFEDKLQQQKTNKRKNNGTSI